MGVSSYLLGKNWLTAPLICGRLGLTVDLHDTSSTRVALSIDRSIYYWLDQQTICLKLDA